MDRGTRLVLLAVFGAGVFLAGLELMITAVALPSILADLVQANGTSAWAELRKASWIINGYLLIYILMMPRFSPIIAACVRSWAPNFERIFLTRDLTVSSVIDNWSAICLLALPAAINLKTFTSAGVRASSVECSAIW